MLHHAERRNRRGPGITTPGLCCVLTQSRPTTLHSWRAAAQTDDTVAEVVATPTPSETTVATVIEPEPAPAPDALVGGAPIPVASMAMENGVTSVILVQGDGFLGSVTTAESFDGERNRVVFSFSHYYDR